MELLVIKPSFPPQAHREDHKTPLCWKKFPKERVT